MSSPNNKVLLDVLRSQWLAGGSADALSLAAEHPELAEDPSAFAALAYEEYCLRRADGQAVEVEEFCRLFPTAIRNAIRDMLAVDQLFGENPQVLDEAGPTTRDYPAAGEKVCGCVLLRELGRGRFSTAYLACDVEAGGRMVVLKLSRLVTGEGGVLGPLAHAHVVPLHWSRHDPETGWNVICMPFLGAATLAHVIGRLYPSDGPRTPATGSAIVAAIAANARPNDPPPARPPVGPTLAGLSVAQAAARLGRTLASALAYLHDRRLFHGDVKPSNVLMLADGQALLLDFNLSRGGPLGRVGGTFPYMAPEQLGAFLAERALPPDQATAADVWALGVILYELLTGALPYGGVRGDPRQCAEVMTARQQSPATPVRRLAPAVPARLAALVERCLSRDHGARPSAAEVAAALTEAPPRPRVGRLLTGAVMLLFGALVGVGGGACMRLPAQEVELLAVKEDEETARQRGCERLAEGRRLLAQGLTLEARQALHEADEAFSIAITARKQSGERRGAFADYFNRGKVQLSLGDLVEARRYFEQAQDACRDEKGQVVAHGPTLAYVAYCYALKGDQQDAIAAATLALKARQAPTAAVHNNLAFSLLQRPSPGYEARVLASTEQALALDPDCLAAYRNRAMVAFHRALANCDRPPGAAARRDVEVAIALARRVGRAEPAVLHYVAARMAVLDGRAEKNDGPQRQEYYRQAREYAIAARQQGQSADSLKIDPLLKDVLGDCLDGVGVVTPYVPAPWVYLVEPVSEP